MFLALIVLLLALIVWWYCQDSRHSYERFSMNGLREYSNFSPAMIQSFIQNKYSSSMNNLRGYNTDFNPTMLNEGLPSFVNNIS